MKTRKQTKEEKTGNSNREMEDIDEIQDVPRRSSRQSKSQSVGGVNLRQKGKRKSLSNAVVNVVFGKVHNVVADVDELRRKRKQDTLRCGRVSRVVGSASNRSRSSERGTAPTELEGGKDHSMPPKHANFQESHGIMPATALASGELLQFRILYCFCE